MLETSAKRAMQLLTDKKPELDKVSHGFFISSVSALTINVLLQLANALVEYETLSLDVCFATIFLSSTQITNDCVTGGEKGY